MDASKVLHRKGWRGLGYSLDKKNRGIVHPLMIKYKDNTLGLGKEVRTLPSDQWWLRAFDESLALLGTGAKTTLSNIAKKGVTAGGGLYSFFVRGEGLHGTIQDENTENQRPDKKRKRDSTTEKESKKKNKSERKEKRSRSKTEKEVIQSSLQLPGPVPTPPSSNTSLCDSPITPGLSAKKLAKLTSRAERKGVTVVKYLERREKKKIRKMDRAKGMSGKESDKKKDKKIKRSSRD